MTAFEILSIISQFDLALLPLLALALLPTLTASLGTVGASVATTALAAGLGAGQGAIISAATGQDPGRGAAIGAGTGALTGGLGSAAGAGGQAAEAAAQGTDVAVQTGQGLQTGAQATQALSEPVGVGIDPGIVPALGPGPSAPPTQAGFSVGSAPKPTDVSIPENPAVQALANQSQISPIRPEGSTFPLSSSEMAPQGLPQGARLGESGVLPADSGIDKGELIAKALGGLSQTLGQGASQPAQGPQNIERRSLPRGRPSSGPRPIDPVLALLSEIKRRQAMKIQERTFF